MMHIALKLPEIACPLIVLLCIKLLLCRSSVLISLPFVPVLCFILRRGIVEAFTYAWAPVLSRHTTP